MNPITLPPSALAEARALVEGLGLRFEAGFDEMAGLYEDGVLVACGARAGYVLKMMAIAPSHQGTDALGSLVTHLVLAAREAGQDTVFVFTPPRNAPSFQALNFRLLVTEGESALLEYGPGLEAYLAAQTRTPGNNGAVLINGNPFTLGHLHLVTRAAQGVDRLYLFVVQEDRSVFPFEVRLRLAREATAHLDNVTVLGTSRYAVSTGTFPSYFLKRLDQAATIQMRLDLTLFAQRIAPAFHITQRFVGQEPLCPTTAAYNLVMADVLEAHGIRCVELPRLQAGSLPISASRVRQALAEGNDQALEALVPPATLAFLRSPAGNDIAHLMKEN